MQIMRGKVAFWQFSKMSKILIRNKTHLPHIRFAFSFSWKGTSAKHLITFPFLLLRISQAVVVVTVHGGCHKQVPCLTPYNGSPTQVCASVAYDLGHGLPSSCVGWLGLYSMN